MARNAERQGGSRLRRSSRQRVRHPLPLLLPPREQQRQEVVALDRRSLPAYRDLAVGRDELRRVQRARGTAARDRVGEEIDREAGWSDLVYHWDRAQPRQMAQRRRVRVARRAARLREALPHLTRGPVPGRRARGL